MVLKIATPEGWRFIDGVRQVQVNTIEGVNHDNYDDVFLYYHTINKEGKMQKTGVPPNTEPPPVRELYVTLVGTITKSYLADLAVYLMSDEGKTIERLS